MKTLLLTILVICPLVLFSQSTIKGVVYDSLTKAPVQGVNVTVAGRNSVIAGFAVTGNGGGFTIKYRGNEDSLTLSVSGIDYKKMSRRIPSSVENLKLYVQSAPLTLNEIKIKAPSITRRGDTLNYLVEKYLATGDRTIADVLKKMPGIQVSDNGAILYNNKPINKFYIENMDLLQGRYGVATNNIEAKDVASVQVMENHQPVKMLKDIEFTDEAAINLKLKNSAKGVLVANAQLGAGAAPLLTSNEMTGMIFARKFQNMSLYKGDNTGRGTDNEFAMMIGGDNQMQSPVRLGILSPSNPDIRRQRYYFNESHALSFNDIRKTGNDYTFNTNINYQFNDINSESYSETKYYLPDNTIIPVVESLSANKIAGKIDAEFNLNFNEANRYFNNKLKLNGDIPRSYGNIESAGTIVQRLSSPSYSIGNNFEYFWKKGSSSYRIYMEIGYFDNRQTLTINPLHPAELFGELPSGANSVQQTEYNDLRLRNYMSWTKSARLTKQLRLDFNADLMNFRSELYGKEGDTKYETADSLKNRYNWNNIQLQLAREYRYDISEDTYLRLYLPVGVINSEGKNYFSFRPSALFSKKLNPFLNMNLRYTYSNGYSSVPNQIDNYIMLSYRNIQNNAGLPERQELHQPSLNFFYRNALTSLFGTLNVNYNFIRSSQLAENMYNGIIRYKSAYVKTNYSGNLAVQIYLAKDVEKFALKLFITANYNNIRSEILNNGIVSGYKSSLFSMNPGFSKNFTENVNINYRLRFMYTKNAISANTTEIPGIKSISQNTELNVRPVKNFTIRFSADHYYNSYVASGSRNMWFADAGLKYKIKKAEFMLDYTNIFNTENYVSESFTENIRYFYSYRMRPAEILLRVRFKII
jgi:hypothetical protein